MYPCINIFHNITIVFITIIFCTLSPYLVSLLPMCTYIRVRSVTSNFTLITLRVIGQCICILIVLSVLEFITLLFCFPLTSI